MDKPAEYSQDKQVARCAWSRQQGALEEVTIAEQCYGVLPEYVQALRQQLENQQRYEPLLTYLLMVLLMMLTFSFLFSYIALMKSILLMMWLLVFVFPWLFPLDFLGMRSGLRVARVSAFMALVMLLIFL